MDQSKYKFGKPLQLTNHSVYDTKNICFGTGSVFSKPQSFCPLMYLHPKLRGKKKTHSHKVCYQYKWTLPKTTTINEENKTKSQVIIHTAKGKNKRMKKTIPMWLSIKSSISEHETNIYPSLSSKQRVLRFRFHDQYLVYITEETKLS